MAAQSTEAVLRVPFWSPRLVIASGHRGGSPWGTLRRALARYAGPVVSLGGGVEKSWSIVRVVVEVMPKAEILDPQGKAVRGALARLGFDAVTDVRQGKRFEIEIAGPVDPAALDRVREMAETLLANPVIEDFTVRTEDSVLSTDDTASTGDLT